MFLDVILELKWIIKYDSQLKKINRNRCELWLKNKVDRWLCKENSNFKVVHFTSGCRTKDLTSNYKDLHWFITPAWQICIAKTKKLSWLTGKENTTICTFTLAMQLKKILFTWSYKKFMLILSVYEPIIKKFSLLFVIYFQRWTIINLFWLIELSHSKAA